MKKKSPQKNEPTPEYDPLRQQNVLLEKIHTEVKAIAEGHSGLDRKIDKTNEKMDDMNSDLQMIKSKVVEHDKRFDRIESAIIENSKDMQLLKAGQQRIEQKLDTVTQGHEQRIQKLETVH
mgnify:CR=1 FL=1